MPSFKLLFIVAIISLTYSCSTPQHTDRVENTANKGTEYGKAYFPLFRDKEPSGYGMYTYILMRTKITSEQTNDDNSNLNKLLTFIFDTSDITSNIITQEKPYTNLFIYPSKRKNLKREAYITPQYDFIRSRGIVSVIQKALWNTTDPGNPDITETHNRLRTRSGPFLISMSKPIHSLDKDSNISILFADLSEYKPEAISTVVEEYMKSLNEIDTGVVMFDSKKVNLLNILLSLDEAADRTLTSGYLLTTSAIAGEISY
jgi:hypothetical protein